MRIAGMGREGNAMKCPFCGSEMEGGFVRCRDGVRWSPGRPPVAALAAFMPGSVVLGGCGDDESETTAVAHRCPGCKMVVIPYED